MQVLLFFCYPLKKPCIHCNMKKLIILFIISYLLICSALAKSDLPLFLSSLGYEVSESCTEKTFTIPIEFDMVYNGYNEIQKDAGFDLSPYKGRTCTMYTYEIYNHPFGKCNANIIVYKGEIIGGDISSINLDGFMTGLV